MAESFFRESLSFFDEIGLFDVVLPFLLVFTIVFAILEKTKVLGMEKVGSDHMTKKNLNAIVAFCIAFLVLASSELVEIIVHVSSRAVILLFLAVLYLILVGAFMKEEDAATYLKGKWMYFFMVVMLIGISFIFLDAIEDNSGDTWLEIVFDWVEDFSFENKAVGAILLLGFTVGIVWVIIYDGNKKGGPGNIPQQ